MSLFNLVPLPALVQKGSPLGRELGNIHSLVGWYFLILIGLHIAAALYHRFVLRDDVLARMLPAR
ncbi:MAG TPA: cytochrome b/b6 domain-containing protein [Alphaproteobacteria bacterium]